ncbi:hypothetical protein Pla163_15730 [Planctomycetes bacterium Pla163]|uniref:Methyltransferase domain protein n=1 Tax=Rohdeia mirabilis TaxID=2528008 RepID=A0A518CZ07_9BACT|nr:hypothetical protein Pla163_15730 [Planctomycetes bacterium Pla163]
MAKKTSSRADSTASFGAGTALADAGEAPAAKKRSSTTKASTTKASTTKAGAAKKGATKKKAGRSAASSAEKGTSRKNAAKKRAAKKGAGKKKSGRGAKTKYTAKTADRHELYQLSVQSPDADVDFLVKTYRKLRGQKPTHLREDFCGTGYLMAEWLRRNDANTAEGYDIDPDPVEWGKARNFEGIEDPFERAHFHLEDVREPSRVAPQVRTAPNFSWMIFTDRPTLLSYFKAVHADLAADGLFIFDIYGGFEAFEEMEETRRIPAGFTYVWDQVSYHPATGDYHCRIHFRFKDGTKLKSAFDYRWRLWNLPEVVDIAREAGFSAVDSYWEGTDEDGESGNGEFKKHAKGENCPAWVTYVVAQK